MSSALKWEACRERTEKRSEMRIYCHELQQNYRLLLIWSAVIAGMNMIIMLIFPQLADQAQEMEAVYANLGAFSDAFGMDRLSFVTPMGFYGVEGGAMISIGGGMLAGLLGSSILSKEEGRHTAEFLFTMPLRREEIALQKLAALLSLIAAFHVICAVCGAGAFAIIGEAVEWKPFLLYHLAQLLMQAEIGLICFGVSAFLRRVSLGTGIGIAMLLYFLQLSANISDKLDWLKYITPYYYADAASILPREAVDWKLAALGMAYGILAAGVGIRRLGRKDLSC